MPLKPIDVYESEIGASENLAMRALTLIGGWMSFLNDGAR
jgi:hypothetical protein